MDTDYPIRFTVIQKDMHGTTKVFGVGQMDWRKVLVHKRISTLIELNDQLDPDVSVGILDLSIELSSADTIPEPEFEFYLKQKANREEDLYSQFFIHAKQWWNDYLQIRSSHSTRLVKIFALDEFGSRLPVTNFLVDIGRWIDTPRHAARFVSLIDQIPLKRIGDGKSLEIWSSRHTFLSAKRGDVQDHCVLLCSLFLGFHLDAYVTLGTDQGNNTHTWVTTIDSLNQVHFWEVLTGIRYSQQDQHHFRTIGCCFNHKDLFANVQVIDSANATRFQMNDPTLWKKLTPPERSPIPFALCYQPIDTITKEIEIEMELTQSIEFFRLDHHLGCVWDETLSTMLNQALWTLESSKLSNNSHSFSDEFQLGMKRYLPEGHTFKGFPICFNHMHSQKMFSQMTKSKKCKDIMLTRGDCVRMALKVKVTSFSDGVISCWVMIASRSLQ